MNITKKILLACFISIGIIACSDDDDDTVEPDNNGNNSATLTGGTWEAFEFEDNKGVIYGINEWVPEYDTVNGCEVVTYEDKTIKEELTFSTSTVLFEGEWEGRGRTLLSTDTACNPTYTPWNTQSFNDTDTSNYEVSGTNIIVWEDSVTADTVPSEIRNGLLYIYAGTEEEYYYRKK